MYQGQLSTYFLLKPNDRSPLLLEEAAELAVHLAGHVGFLLERFQRVRVAIAA